MTRAHPALVIHGGTGPRPSGERIERVRASLRAIADRAYDFLSAHSALETTIFAVQMLEDDPLYNAGTGSMLQADGRARMSASVMDGARGAFAAVINVERVRNPVLVAATLLDEPDRVLAGPQAVAFARSQGFGPWNPITTERRTQWRKRQDHRHGTVGAVALDRRGRLAAATSTGGRGFERPGRVSDSAMPVGNYASATCAVSCTGFGEHILDEALAVRIVQRTTDGASLPAVVSKTFRELKTRKREAGAIALDRRGRAAWSTTLPILYAAMRTRTDRRESF